MRPQPPALAMVLAGLVGLSACDRPAMELTPASLPTKARGSAASMSVDDILICSQVKSALVAAEDINGTAILVTAKDGKVTLTGSIPARQIKRAGEVARDVEGVREVNNQLRPIGVMA